MRDAVQVLQDLATRREPRREACDLGAAVRETLALVWSDALTRHVAVELDIEHDLPAVSGDGLFIRQALLNVLVAALETTPPDSPAHGTIFIAVHRAGNSAEVVLKSPALSAASDDFANWELSLARSVVAIHGGALTVQPLADGGAVVTTTWPLHAP
jgi:signal transduction histidine kinase